MRRIIFVVLLLFSFAAHALTTVEWNKRFAELNNAPLNLKWTASGQQNYYKTLIASKPNYFKNPDDYPVTTLGGNVTVVPVVTDTSIKDIIARIKSDVDKLILITGN